MNLPEGPITFDYVRSRARDIQFINLGEALTSRAVEGEETGVPVSTVVTAGCVTLCLLILDNGFSVTGQSACANPAEYDRDLGEKYAFEDALRKAIPHYGFLRREHLHGLEVAEAEAKSAAVGEDGPAA